VLLIQADLVTLNTFRRLITQYFDMLREIGAGNKCLFLPHSPAGMNDISEQIRNAFLQEVVRSRSNWLIRESGDLI